MTPNWKVFDDIPFAQRFSITKANLLDSCPLKFGIQYEEKIGEPPSNALRAGGYFDWLCSGQKDSNPGALMSPVQRRIVEVRYDSYKGFIYPEDEIQVPVKWKIPGSNKFNGKFFWLTGFIDRHEARSDTNIDHKFGVNPWTIEKLLEGKRQAQGYMFATANPRFRFDVLCSRAEGIQRFPGIDSTAQDIMASWYNTNELDEFIEWLHGTLQTMVSKNREPRENKLCKYCHYKVVRLCTLGAKEEVPDNDEDFLKDL